MACITSAFTELKNNCETSMGGIKNIWISPWESDMATTGSTSGDMEAGEVSLPDVSESTGIAKFTHFYVKRNTTSFTSTLTVDPANGVNYVSTVLSVVFNKMDAEKRIAMATLAKTDVAIVVEDANGIMWFLGKDEPVIATAGTGETGTAKTDGNRYTIEFTDESKGFPYKLDRESESAFRKSLIPST